MISLQACPISLTDRHLTMSSFCPVTGVYLSPVKITGMISLTKMQIHFTNRCTFCFLNQLFMFCNLPLMHSTIIGSTLSIGISPIFKCQENKCKNPINLSAPLVELPIFSQRCCGILISQVLVQAQ